MYIPIAVVVLSNILYHVCSKATPDGLNPFAALTVTYLIGAALSFILYLVLNRGGDFVSELKQLNWSTWLLGLSIVGLETGTIYMYKTGWNISVGSLIQSSILAICLVIIGVVFYKEHISLTKGIGIAICTVGLIFINI